MSLTDNQREALLAEYKALNKFQIHLDEINWQVGSILVGGSIAGVALSFSVGNTQLKLAPVFVSLAGIVAVVSWFFFARRNRGYMMFTVTRMRAIEQQLELQFHEILWKADHNNPSHQLTFQFLRGPPEVVTMPTPTAWQTMTFLAVGITAVFATIIIFVILVTL